jgi:ribosomal-protein-alanine N-acetyltransferase
MKYSKKILLSSESESFHDPPSLVFTSMKLDDVGEVAWIERVSFPTPYSAEIFRNELLRKQNTAWWIVRPDQKQNLRSLPPILGYVGYKIENDGRHLSKIATHPNWRRCKIGEWMMLNMLLVAHMDGASKVTLEVRDSNKAALGMYFKLKFVEIARIKRYYTDTGEDGRILKFAGLDDTTVSQRLLQAIENLSIVVP